MGTLAGPAPLPKGRTFRGGCTPCALTAAWLSSGDSGGAVARQSRKALRRTMALFNYATLLGAGVVVGVYLAQNYDVPNVRKTLDIGMERLKALEAEYRKGKWEGGSSRRR